MDLIPAAKHAPRGGVEFQVCHAKPHRTRGRAAASYGAKAREQFHE
jgi:hypothetical protein